MRRYPNGVARTFSPEQSAVFDQPTRSKTWQVGAAFIDLYDLLGVPDDAHPREIDEAITGRSAEVLQFSFARGGGGEWIATLEQHLPEFRTVLLVPSNRARYDALMQRHRADDNAESYDEFFRSLAPRASAAGCLNMVVFAAGVFALRLFCA